MKVIIRHYLSATIVGLLLIVGATAQEELTQKENAPDEAAATTAQPTPVVEPKIKLVHVLNPGEREYLSPNLIGVQNIAMTFLPLSMNFINVIDAYREIVNGVRYEIILNAVDTKAQNEDIICRLVILEKPWLRTEWGDKYRELVNSNCTDTNDALADAEPAERSKALNDKYTTNAIFNGGTRNELTDDEMARLESQIMPVVGSNNKRQALASTSTSTSTSTTTTTTTTTESAAAVEQNEPETSTAASAKVTPAINADDGADASGKGSGRGRGSGIDNQRNDENDAEDEAATKTPELSDNEKQWLDDILSMGAYNFEKRIEEQKQQNSPAGIEAEAISNIQADNQSELPKAQAEAETAASSAADVNVVESESESREPQPQPQQQQQLARSKRSSWDANLVGGSRAFSNDEAKERLQATLDKLATGDGPNYRISKVYEATRQVVAGELMTIEAELIDANNEIVRCTVEIWSRAWINDHQVKFKCDNKPVQNARHSRSVEYAEKKTHKKHNHHTLDKTEHLFHKFQIKFKRVYGSTMERQMRMRIFRQNLKTIEELNRNEMGSAKYGITEFADMTSTDYKQRTGLWQREANRPTGGLKAVVPEIDGELPKEFDWRQKNAVTHVKNQGNCGSCWAFSVTGNIEGLYALKTGQLEEFSEQELLDCDTVDSACNGGLPDNAYKAIKEIGGLEYENEYPYLAKKNQCHFNKTLSHVKIDSFVDLPHNETAMQQWLIANGPISIGINANAMQFYRGGVSHPWKPLCSHSNLDHGVLIVGYGVSDYPNFHKTLPYWIVKNSWGPRWGEQGYYRVYRGDNTCGVSEMATSAVLA